MCGKMNSSSVVCEQLKNAIIFLSFLRNTLRDYEHFMALLEKSGPVLYTSVWF